MVCTYIRNMKYTSIYGKANYTENCYSGNMEVFPIIDRYSCDIASCTCSFYVNTVYKIYISRNGFDYVLCTN